METNTSQKNAVTSDDKSLITIGVAMSPDLARQAGERARAQDLNRSQYLRRLVRRDLGLPLDEGGSEVAEATKPVRAKGGNFRKGGRV